MVRLVTKESTKATLLVPKNPDVIIFTDASIEGIGGVMCCAKDSHPPLVFRMPFPDDIAQSIRNTMKGLKEISISDGDALALLAGLLITIMFLNLAGKSIALFCDNAPTVG